MTSPSSAATPLADRAAWDGLLPALLDEDPDELLVTETLLERVDVVGELTGLVGGLADLLAQASAPATRRAYESDLAHFTGWAARYGLAALPAAPQTVALYLAAHEDSLRPATLIRRLSAIAVAHRSADLPAPTWHELVRRAVAAVRRKHGTRPAAKAALVTAQLAVICARLHQATLPAPVRDELPARRALGL